MASSAFLKNYEEKNNKKELQAAHVLSLIDQGTPW